MSRGKPGIPNVELPYFFVKDVWQLFGYASMITAGAACRRGTFPVHVYRLGLDKADGPWVAERECVIKFFEDERKKGAIHYQEKYGDGT